MVISQKKAVKKKFMAATSMLLIACIMLISASYAWFTLSTAPEVKGITTTVGANGSLEIALATTESWNDTSKITSDVADSSKVSDITEANITWGNLVDLATANDDYGLGKLTLLPSALKTTEAGDGDNKKYLVDPVSPLQTPEYGEDGRVASLVANTTFAKYDGSKFPADDTVRGVRAIGSALAMTDRQIAYRNAKATINTTKTAAQGFAAGSLTANGNALANIIMAYVQDGTNATYKVSDVETLRAMVTALENAYNALENAEQAVILGFLASSSAEKLGITDTAFSYVEDKVKNKEYTLDDDGNVTIMLPVTGDEGTTTTEKSFTVPTGEILTNINGTATKIGTAISEADELLETLEATAASNPEAIFSWSDLSPAIRPLVNPDAVKINDHTADEVKADLNIVINAITGDGIKVQMVSGSGVYADIADLCGDYSAQVKVTVSYAGATVSPSALMTTKTSINPSYFDAAVNEIDGAGSPSSATAANLTLTDFYGYAIDLFLRTNAENSNLLLQTAPAQRIYSDSTEEATQGGGSTMTFASSTGLTTDEIKGLMSAIRVVFMDKSGTVYSFARLETEKARVGTTNAEVTADLRLCDATGKLLGTYSDAGEITAYDSTIVGLNANEPLALTALVYLDGSKVTNAMVANAATSMTGSMNLQFASDANLVPMQNTALKGQTSTSTDETPEVQNIESTDPQE